MYKAILFDLDGTLIDFEASVAHALREAFRHAGFEVDDAASWDLIWEAYTPIGDRYWRRCTQESWSRDQVIAYTMRDTLAALGMDKQGAPALAPRLAAAYWDAFCRTACLNPGAREILERLAPHFRLGLVTNGEGEAQRGRLRAAELDGYFSCLVISEEAGYTKPAREIFDLALAKLGVGAGEALYVGDSVEHDYHGARNAGIDFCHYQPDGQSHRELPPRFRVSDLRDLAHVLELT
jgi:2-haloacid dehalogenase